MRHQARRIEGTRGQKYDANAFSLRIERHDVVVELLVFTAVPFVLRRITQKITVNLLDMVFGERQHRPRCEDRFHYSGIACYFLLISCIKGLYFNNSRKFFHVPTQKLLSLDTLGLTHTFDPRYPSS